MRSGGIWLAVMVLSGGIWWCYLVGSGGIWCYLVGSGGIWRCYLVGSGGIGRTVGTKLRERDVSTRVPVGSSKFRIEDPIHFVTVRREDLASL